MIKLGSNFLSFRDPIAEGGEATIYKYNRSVIKLFKDKKSLISKQKKITKLLSLKLPDGVIGPKDMVVDSNDNFVGYSMNEVEGEEIRKLCSKKFLKLNNISTKNIVDMLLKFAKILDELHASNIIIGDLNECNILFDSQFNIYIIDVDSWKIGNFKCTVAMETFQDPTMSSSNFSQETDWYAFAILTFKILTMLHPFGGTLDPDVSILDRMKKNMSVLNTKHVTIPTRLCKGWKFFSPRLLDDLKKIFTTSERFSLTNTLQDFYDNLKFCVNHKDFYYSKYSKCPHCYDDAYIIPDLTKSKPVVAVNSKPTSTSITNTAKKPSKRKSTTPVIAPIKVDNTQSSIPTNIVFNDSNIKAMLNQYAYVDNNNIVRFRNNAITYTYNPIVDYYLYDNDKTIVSNKDVFAINAGNHVIKFEKLSGSKVIINEKDIYYIDKTKVLTKVIYNENGNIVKSIQHVSFENYFNVYDEDHYIIINKYNGRSIVCVDGYNHEVELPYKINDYGLQYDPISKTWLAILKEFNGRCHTMIFKQNKIIYMNDKLQYSCQLDFIAYYKGIIYIPKDGYIRGYNYTTNNYKDFKCTSVVDDCKLIKNGSKFIAISEDSVFEIG